MSLLAGFEHIVRENEPMAPFTRLKIGGSAEYFAEPTSIDELTGLVQRFSENGMPIRLIGNGTNVLIRDEGVPGLVVQISAPDFSSIAVNGNRLTAGGGARMSHFVSTAVREGLAGPEQLVGIPGTVGGALYHNLGAQGVGIGSWVESVELLTRGGERVTRDKDHLAFSYRQSSLTELVVLSATFEFEKEDSAELTRQMQKLWIVRRANQPMSNENATYIFKDHGSEPAAELIDRAGLKGSSVGKISISEQNANFFVAQPGASFGEAIELMEQVQTAVNEKLEIQLEPAIQVW